jgi:3-oxoacyl-[acyl-carrier protein] reductase
MNPTVAVVTGASRGIGLAIARSLAEAGTDLCVCARSEDAVREATAALRSRVRVIAERVDVRNAEEVEALFARCRRDLGPVDWLVNNAGVVDPAPLGELSEERWDAIIDTNLKGPFLCTRAALPDLVARRGRIVNIGSISGTLGTAKSSPYNASKWGLNGLTLSWAEEFKPSGVFVAAVLPGSVDTDMLKQSGFPPDMQPEEIARIVRFLLLDAPFAMTGALINAFG